MNAHFEKLGPKASSPFQSGTRSKEKLIGDLQGKIIQFQSLDAQAVVGSC